jgi:hypothetical protein
VDRHLDRHVAVDAEYRFPKGQAEDNLGIGSRHGAGTTTTAAVGRSAHPVEEGIEEVTEASSEGITLTSPEATSTSPCRLPEYAGRPESVIPGAPLGVTEHLVGQADLFEALLGHVIAVVCIGMELTRLLPIRTLQFLIGGATPHSEELVQVSVGHRRDSLSR